MWMVVWTSKNGREREGERDMNSWRRDKEGRITKLQDFFNIHDIKDFLQDPHKRGKRENHSIP